MLHTFAPNHYHHTLGSHAPVLTLQPGDRVRTTTVDAAGVDAAGAQVTHGPNPTTGPFAIAGAQPGDTLQVTLHAITPNRPMGWSGTALAANVVEPEAAIYLPRPRKGGDADGLWEVDVAANRATLVGPGSDGSADAAGTRLAGLTLPLAPMIGCFGVAPAGGEAISTATSGQHGGNMDWRGFTAGVVVRFPVFVPGALFFLGDVHARQGHGEIAGTGIEISADVEFSVELLRDRPQPSPAWPQADDGAFLCTVGNARPLEQALQHATTAMAQLLQVKYGLEARSAQTLMGQVVEYEIANVFNPAFSVVCKMPKAVLALLPNPQSH